MTTELKYTFGIAAGVLLIIFIQRRKGTGRKLKDYGSAMMSKYFGVPSFYASQVAVNNGITEQFEPVGLQVYNAGRGLAQFILDPLQEHLQMSITINSWYRSPELNQFLVDSPLYNAAANSTHMSGGTADIKLVDDIINGVHIVNNARLVRLILDLNLPFDRLLLEGGTVEAPDWLHVEYNANNTRRQILVLPNGMTGYEISIDQAKDIFNVG